MDLQSFFANKGKKGLANVGATCYLNTATQCLSYCLEFLHYVLSARYKKDAETHGRTIDENALISELRSLLVEMWMNGHSLIPRRFVNAINKNLAEMEIYQQNDINEFLAYFIDRMNKDVCYTNIPTKEELISKNKYKNTPYDIQRYKMDISWHERVGKEYSELVDLFYGQSITQVICGHCKNITHNYEIYSSMMVPVDDSTDTLYDCLKMHFKDEILNEEIEWKCDECKHKSKSKKTTRLWRNPKVLIISLKRFTFDMQKNNKHIEIPSELSLQQFALSHTDSVYRLRAVAYHVGSYHGGHYFALCKHPDNKWYMIDDLNVTETTDPDIGKGYVYFYTLA
jgi:ubiquitin C-terminal hydrolase